MDTQFYIMEAKTGYRDGAWTREAADAHLALYRADFPNGILTMMPVKPEQDRLLLEDSALFTIEDLAQRLN